MSKTMTRAELERVITDLRGDRPKLMIRIHFFATNGRITSIELLTGTKRSIAKFGGSPKALAAEYAGRAIKVEVA